MISSKLRYCRAFISDFPQAKKSDILSQISDPNSYTLEIRDLLKHARSSKMTSYQNYKTRDIKTRVELIWFVHQLAVLFSFSLAWLGLRFICHIFWYFRFIQSGLNFRFLIIVSISFIYTTQIPFSSSGVITQNPNKLK